MVIGEKSIKSISEMTGEGRETHILTSRSVSKTRYFQKLVESLPYAEVLDFITQHTPVDEVSKITHHLSEHSGRYLITVGGGSVIDAGKVARNDVDIEIKQIAVPTTLSAAEFSHIAGYSEQGIKKGIRKKQLVPRYIYLDPEATAETPMELWRSTGIRSIDHAVESTLGEGLLEFKVNMAFMSLQKLMENLRNFGENERLQCQIGSWYSYMNVYDSPMGYSHNIGKIIGARWGVPHGITSCITLPEILRYYSKRPPAGLSSLAAMVTGKNGGEGILFLAEKIEMFIDELGLKRKLSDYGIRVEDVDYIYKMLDTEDIELKHAIMKML
ncbi:MAG: iron-containing alcohol dehydrogenase [Thermoplasmatales archaeon]